MRTREGRMLRTGPFSAFGDGSQMPALARGSGRSTSLTLLSRPAKDRCPRPGRGEIFLTPPPVSAELTAMHHVGDEAQAALIPQDCCAAGADRRFWVRRE